MMNLAAIMMAMMAMMAFTLMVGAKNLIYLIH